jgi:hypothetical protein
MISTTTSEISQPVAAGSPIGDILNCLDDAGFEAISLDESGAIIRRDGWYVQLEAHPITQVRGGAPGVDGENGDDVPQDHPSWENPDTWEIGPAVPSRESIAEPTADESTAEEWREQMDPFSRNRLSVDGLRTFARAVADFDLERGHS